MPDNATQCPHCARPLSPGAPEGLCPSCLIASLSELMGAAADEAPAPMPALATPHERVGDYELLDELGRGGMGVVFRARDLRLKRDVALKLILTGQLASEAEVKRFRNEAEAVAQLEHPNIVPIYEVGESGGRHFFAMKLVEGGTLAERMSKDEFRMTNEDTGRARGPFDIRHATFVISKVARAVHHAHQRGILHRDLKPGNILLDAQGEPLVADFGLARHVESASSLTLSGAALGSPSYMAPEQATGGARAVTTAADIYSLGAILYELLCGQPPFVAATPLETMRQVVERDPVPPSQLRSSRRKEARTIGSNAPLPQKSQSLLTSASAGVDRDLETICLKCLAKDPTRRYATAEALAEDLERWLRHEPIRARPSSVWERTSKWGRRHPARASLIALAAVAPAIILTILLVANARVRFALSRAVGEGERASHALAQVKIEVERTKTAAARAEAGERSAQLHLYAADMAQAWRTLEDGNLGGARAILEAHRPKDGRPDFRGFEWHLFRQMAQGKGWSEIGPQTNRISTMALTPDGRNIFTGDESDIRIWDLEQSKGVGKIPATRIDLASSTPALHYLRLRLTSPGFAARADPFETEENLYPDTHPFRARAGWRLRVSADQQWLATQQEKGFPTLWNLRERAWVSALPVRATDIAFWPGPSNRVAVGSAGGFGEPPDDIIVFDPATRKEIRRFPGAGGCFGFSTDGRWLCAQDQPGHLRLIDTTTETVRWTRNNHTASEIKISPNRRWILVLRDSATAVLLLDFEGGATLLELGHNVSVLSAAFSPDGRWVATGGRDQSVRLWDLNNRTEVRRFQGHADIVVAVDFAPDSRSIFSAGRDGRLLRWDLSAFHDRPRIALRPPFIGSPDDRCHVAMDQHGGLVRFDLTTRTVRPLAAPFDHGMFCPLALDRAGRSVLLTGLTDSNAHPSVTWVDLETGQHTPMQTQTWTRPGYFLPGATSDGKVLAGLDAAGTVQFWSEGTIRRGRKAFARSAAFTSDESLAFAMADWDGVVEAFETATWRKRFDFSGGTSFHNITLPRDGSLLAVPSSGNRISLLETKGGRVVGTFSGHAARVTHVALSPDGRTLVSSSDDASIRLWHVPTQRVLAVLSRGETWRDVWFSPSGRWLLTETSTAGSYHCWESGEE